MVWQSARLMRSGWRWLAGFWLAVAGIAATGAVVLALLGPPHRGARLAMPAAPPVYAANNAGWPGPPARRIGAPIAAPDAALLEPAPDFPGRSLPRIGPGTRRPAQAYAAFSNAADPRVKIALVVAGIGLDRADSLDAIRLLPAAVSLAVSAYADADDARRVMDAARLAGHETLLSLPMEPDGYPSNDEGTHQLLTGATPAENARQLEWSLSRLQGYAGVTGASDGQHGERFAASPAAMAAVTDELARRGLFYLDPRIGADPPDRIQARAVDQVVGAAEGADDIDSNLAALAQAARQRGAAVALVDRPTPTAIARIAAWAATLPAHGISLIPVSALMLPNAAAGRTAQ